MITKREKLQYGYLFLIDLLSLVLSIGLAWGLTAGVLHKMGDFQLDDLVEACFLLLLAYILTFFTFDQSENIVNRTPIREVEIAVRFNFLLTLIDAACLALTKAPMLHSRYFLVFVPVIDVFVMTGAHAVLKKMLVHSRYTKGIQSLVGVVTTQENASPILEELKKDWSKRVTGLAILEAAPGQLHTEIDGVKIEANFDNFMDWLRQAALDEVYLDIAQESEENMLPYLEEMESMGLTVHFRLPVLDRIEKACCDETSAVRISRELSRCAGGNVVTMGTVELKLRDQVLKRTMDIVGGIVGCIISIPIIALVAIPLKLESPGPLIFKQRRVGRNGRVFYIHKLRSMYVDAEARKKELMAQNEMNGLMFKMEDDPRITRVGRFIRRTSIDELPQLWNILKGDMSIVGPRPALPREVEQYGDYEKQRLYVTPGLSCYWQIAPHRNDLSFEEWMDLDVKYVKERSFWVDWKIIFKTFKVCLLGRGE